MKGRKTGGRKKGVANKTTDETRSLIERTLGASPLEKMAKLARDLLEEKVQLSKPLVVDKVMELVRDRGFELRLASDLLSDVAQYHSPKRKAIEHTGSDGEPLPPAVTYYLPSNARDRNG